MSMGRKSKNSTPKTGEPIIPELDQTATEPADSNPASERPSGFVQRAGAEPAKPAKARLSIPLNEDGSIDTATMRQATRQQVEAFLSNPSNFAALGISGGPAAGPESLFSFTEADAESALNFMNGTNAWATAFVLKRFKGFEIHPAIMERAFVIPEPQKTELKQRGARLMNRYSSEWMRRHADLVFFVLGYLDVVKTQALTAITMQVQHNNMLERAAQQRGARPDAQPPAGVAGANGAEKPEEVLI